MVSGSSRSREQPRACWRGPGMQKREQKTAAREEKSDASRRESRDRWQRAGLWPGQQDAVRPKARSRSRSRGACAARPPLRGEIQSCGRCLHPLPHRQIRSLNFRPLCQRPWCSSPVVHRRQASDACLFGRAVYRI